MTDFGSEEFSFFEFGELFKNLNQADPWKSAGELAASIASDQGSEPNLDPVKRIKLAELVRVAELHVREIPGLKVPSDTTVKAVTKSEWSQQSLTDYKSFFVRFEQALAESMPTDSEIKNGGEVDPLTGLSDKMLGQLFSSLAPMVVSMSVGSMLGHLGQQALGQYDLPIPRKPNQILVVPSNIEAAAEVWAVPAEDLQLWILIHELVTHAVLKIPHVQMRLESLLIDFASAFTPNTELIADQLGSFDSLEQIQDAAQPFADPEVMLSMLRSPAHELIVPQLDALVSAILAYVDYRVSQATDNLIPASKEIRDRFRQRWDGAAPADRFVEKLVGLDIDLATFERGDNFINGVVERAGEEGIAKLWGDELDMPTAAEVNAPGLWLARIGLGDDETLSDFEVPDDLSGLDDKA